MKEIKSFENLRVIDFESSSDVAKMKEALKRVRTELGKHYKALVGGKWLEKDVEITSINPSNPHEVVGYVPSCGEKEADMALEVAWKAFDRWRFTPAEERAEYLFKIADILTERRFEFDAWMVYEVGKNWIEADADLAEAVDMLNFYGREAIRYSKGYKPHQVPEERNELSYIPIGVGAIIPPWNFPVAILVGMASAAIAAGNTVILKPASISSVIAEKIAEVFDEVGLPAGVFNFLPGSGAKVGEYLVKHPKTRFISFTGSKDVGLKINSLAAEHQRGQLWIKRVVLEMGGKDAVIVDETADLDAAAEGIVVSAFGFQGQKCSAGSRAIVVDAVYDEIVKKVKSRVEKIKIGDTSEPENWLGPVSSEGALKKIMSYIEIGKKEGKLLIGGKRLERDGYFIEPTVFIDVNPNAKIAQEEIFGPVLAMIKAKDFEDALKIANSTEYGLTGSLYSKNRERIEKAKREFHVGNLYFNRKCTGALVDVQPFGGFNMSGTDSKAGGRDYLLLFLQAKSITERIS